MPDLTLEQARTFAVVALIVLVLGAVLAAWIMQEIAQKIVVIGVLAVLVLLVWTQRSSLQQCADDIVSDRTSGVPGSTATCTFFGREVEITTSPSS